MSPAPERSQCQLTTAPWAGLTYRDDFELEQCLAFVADEPEAAAALAERGRAYVLEHYQFDAVLDQVEEAIVDWTPAP